MTGFVLGFVVGAFVLPALIVFVRGVRIGFANAKARKEVSQ